ncbi:MAG: hypothetical protein ACTSRG_11510 [Candidatus Helarchaeota archaeon]
MFSYVWTKSEQPIDPMLFSGMMQAINQFVEDSVKKGNVREIHLDKAILILQRSDKYPVICVLIVTKSSHFMRHTLNIFAENFFEKFAAFFSQPNKISNFKPASNLIDEYFAFIPKYE